MPAAKKTEPQAKAEKSAEVVLVQFAYATARDGGEVVMLAKNTPVDAGRFTEESLEHLRSIGFIGPQA